MILTTNTGRESKSLRTTKAAHARLPSLQIWCLSTIALSPLRKDLHSLCYKTTLIALSRSEDLSLPCIWNELLYCRIEHLLCQSRSWPERTRLSCLAVSFSNQTSQFSTTSGHLRLSLPITAEILYARGVLHTFYSTSRTAVRLIKDRFWLERVRKADMWQAFGTWLEPNIAVQEYSCGPPFKEDNATKLKLGHSRVSSVTQRLALLRYTGTPFPNLKKLSSGAISNSQ